MHEYDVALKLLLQGPAELTMRTIAGGPVRRWLNVELPEIRNTRMDLLGEMDDEGLIHIELQSGDDPAMALRMAEYCLRVFRITNRFARQIVLYFGDQSPRMARELRSPTLEYRYELIDFRELDGQSLLASHRIGDNVIAILARLPDPRGAIRQVLGRIAALPTAAEREIALRQLLILAGLRKAEEFVNLEAEHMPILNDIREHKVLGPVYQRGLDRGLQEGELKGELRGELKGELKGERKIVLQQIERRFGKLSQEVKEDLAQRTAPELEELALRILDARSLEELLK